MTKNLSIIATDPSMVGTIYLKYEVNYIDGHLPSNSKDFKVQLLVSCQSDLHITQSILKPIPEISASFDLYLGSIDG